MSDGVRIRDVRDEDLEILFEQQLDPEATRMAAFPARDRDAYLANWARIKANETAIKQTVLLDGTVAGDIGSWEQDGRRLIGYWIGREYWGRGVATAALGLFLERVPARPIYAEVVTHNAGSIRVLEKCGFRRVPGHVTAGDDGIEEILLVLEKA